MLESCGYSEGNETEEIKLGATITWLDEFEGYQCFGTIKVVNGEVILVESGEQTFTFDKARVHKNDCGDYYVSAKIEADAK